MTTVTTPSKPTDTLDSADRLPKVKALWLRVLLTLLLCLGAMMMAGSVFGWLTSLKQEPPRQENAGVSKRYSVTVYQVEPVDLRRVISAFGTAVADREVVVAAEVAGRIVEANQLEVGRAVESATVTKANDGTTEQQEGDLLVRIDPLTYEERVLQAKKLLVQDDVELQKHDLEQKNNQRLLETEKANVKTAQTEYDSELRLRKQRVGTQSAVRRAELDLRRYQDAVIRIENELGLFDVRQQAILSRKDSHASDLELAQLDKKKTTVMPPFSGVLSEVFVEQGQYVRPGEPLVRLTDPNRVELPLSLTLADYLAIAKMRADGVSIRVAFAENETATPRWHSDPLDELRQAPEADELTRTVKVFVEVDNTQQEVPLLPGTFVQARIPGPISKQAVAIPREAVIDGTVFVAVTEPPGPEPPASTRPSIGDSRAWYAVARRRPVTIGRKLQSLVFIDKGLDAGDWVVTTNLDVIHEGARLKIEPAEGERTLADELADLRSPQVEVVRQSPAP